MIVVKVGGSLYDLPDLGDRLSRWLITESAQVLLVPGGGDSAELVRTWYKQFSLSQEAAHWLALRMVSVNAYFLVELLGWAQVVSELTACLACWGERIIPVLDLYAFAQTDERHADSLPHDWTATSDAFALRVAQLMRADRLVLLKSMDWAGGSWAEAAQQGVVDQALPKLLEKMPSVKLEVVNLRSRAWDKPSDDSNLRL